MLTYKVGDKLKNGAVILDIREKSSDGYVVLASWQRGGTFEFVTWRCSAEGDTYWGHYFPYLGAATADFNQR